MTAIASMANTGAGTANWRAIDPETGTGDTDVARALASHRLLHRAFVRRRLGVHHALPAIARPDPGRSEVHLLFHLFAGLARRDGLPGVIGDDGGGVIRENHVHVTELV